MFRLDTRGVMIDSESILTSLRETARWEYMSQQGAESTEESYSLCTRGDKSMELPVCLYTM